MAPPKYVEWLGDVEQAIRAGVTGVTESWSPEVEGLAERGLQKRRELLQRATPNQAAEAHELLRGFGAAGTPSQRREIKDWMMEFAYPDMLPGEPEYGLEVVALVNNGIDLLMIWQSNGRSVDFLG